MSFSARVKEELCRREEPNDCCARAEAYGILLYCNTFAPSEIRVITESGALKSHLPGLFRRAFQVEFDSAPVDEKGKSSFVIRQPAKLGHIFDAFDCDAKSAVALHINFSLLEESHCRTAFFRGAFLAGGSVTDPLKGYHLELVTSHRNVSRELPALMREDDIRPRAVTRAGNYVLYFKQSESIEDFLVTIGSPACAREVWEARTARNLRGRVNRRVNCDAANLDKAVNAAQNQIEAIRTLEALGILGGQPDKLQEAARLRVENPELTLAQLAELCDPPVTKSCYHHRLRKLVELAGPPPEQRNGGN